MCKVHTTTFVALLAPENADYTACHPEKRLPQKYYTLYLSLRRRTSDARELAKNKRQRRVIMIRFKVTPCQTSAGAHCPHLLWAIYTRLLVCRIMAI